MYGVSENSSNVFDHLAGFLTSIPNSWNVLFFKCIILRDALCSKTLPLEPRSSILCDITASGNVDQLAQVGTAFAIITHDLAASTERIERILCSFKSFLMTHLKLRSEVIQFIANLMLELIQRRVKAVNGTFANTMLDFLRLLDELNLSKPRPVHASGAHISCAELICATYLTIFDSETILRFNFLNICLVLLKSTEAKGLFIEFLGLLTDPSRIHGLTIVNLSQLDLKYFDIIRVIDTNLSKLWQLKSLIYFHEQSVSSDVDTTEEGEEISDCAIMDDYTALNFFYWQHMKMQEMNSSTRYYDLNHHGESSVLLFPKIFETPSTQIHERIFLTAGMLQKWNTLLLDMEKEWFWKLFAEMVKSQYPSEKTRMLDYVLAAFLIAHPHSSLSHWATHMNCSTPYQSVDSPLNAIIDHFRYTKECAQSWMQTEEIAFLDKLFFQAIASIDPHDINWLKSRLNQSKVEKMEDVYAKITDGNNLFITLMELLLGCLDVCTPALQNAFLSSKLNGRLDSLATDGAQLGSTLEEVLLMLAVTQNRTALAEQIMKQYFHVHKSQLSFSGLHPNLSTLRLQFIRTHLNQPPFSPIRTALLESLLSTKMDDSVNKVDVAAIRDYVLFL
jgi:hypothetical protein